MPIKVRQKTKYTLHKSMPTLRVCFMALVVYFSIYAESALAQTISNDRGIVVQYNDFLKNHASAEQHQKVVALTTDVQQTIYLKNNQARVYGTAPVCIISDLNSLATEITATPVDAVEIVIVRIANTLEIVNPIDMATLKKFSRLKYIYILSDVEIDAASIMMLTQYNTTYTILHQAVKQS